MKRPSKVIRRAHRSALRSRPKRRVVVEIERIVIHTNFTNTVKREITITLDDLLTPQGLDQLRAVFYDPNAFKSPQTPAQVTQKAAQEFARLAELLRRYSVHPKPAA